LEILMLGVVVGLTVATWLLVKLVTELERKK
jgi:hypothetical protein